MDQKEFTPMPTDMPPTTAVLSGKETGVNLSELHRNASRTR